MKRSLTVLVVALLAAPAVWADTVYVSPSGKDTGAGTQAAPLRTLAGARDVLRRQRPKGPVTVEFAAGTYRFTEPVALEKQDSGTAEGRITYRAADGAEVRFTGGVAVTGWQPVQDAAIRKRLPAEARDHVLVADLKAQGITNLGKLAVRGFSKGAPPAEAELFAGDKPMTLARWPNEGFRGVKKRLTINEVVVDTDRLARWTAESDPWVFAYWHHDWAELYEPIRGIDAAKRILRRDPHIKPIYGITPGRARWYALNLLAELDRPGEYYIDRAAGKLYFWPIKPGAPTVLSVARGIVTARDLSHVTFRGFITEAVRGTALIFRGGEGTKVVGCTIRNTGNRALVFRGGSHHEVYGCDVYDNGEGGISISGGDRKTLTPGKHNVENNHVHRYSRRARTYKTGITISGCGNRMAHNLVHHGPHMALSAGGNDHVVEYNEIHNAVYESGDAGAYYVGRDWTQRGNVLRYNYWHHIVGGTGYGGMTIYLDDQHCGHTIFGNIFERCSQAVFIGGGDDNLVTNNVFLDCWKAAHLDNRGMGWQKKFTQDTNSSIHRQLRAMPYKSELWAKRYPNLVHVLSDDPGVPKRNVFARNISAGGRWDDIYKSIRHLQTVKDNLVFDDDKTWIRLEKDPSGKPIRLIYKDPAKVKAIGFQPIPVAKIGLYKDPRRASWPVTHKVDSVSLPEPGAPRGKPKAHLEPLPTLTVPRADKPASKPMTLSVNYDGALVSPPATARFSHDGTVLHVTVTTPLPTQRDLGATWGASDAVELAFRAPGKAGTPDNPKAPTFVLRGFAGGKTRIFQIIGVTERDDPALAKAVKYKTTVTDNHWTCHWRVPLQPLGLAPGRRTFANVSIRRTATDHWLMWRPTHGDSTHCQRVGTLQLAP